MRSLVQATHVAAFPSEVRKRSRSTRKARLLLFSVAMLLIASAAVVRAQSALDGFDPNANGVVRVIVLQPDGKILIGGSFTTVSGVARNNIARLNPDGSLDASFNPNANSVVNAIALQADGKILVGGSFTNIGAQTRNRIARLEATGPNSGLPDSFNPNASGAVLAIAVQADGKILAGGDFSGANSIGGQMRNRVARLEAIGPNTGLADSFDPNANDQVYAIAIQADGKILVGGQFNGPTSIGGQTRNRIARLEATGPNTGLADSFNPNANGNVLTIAVQADGKILAGGAFSGANGIGGQARNRIARLNATNGLADSFDPNSNDTVVSLAVQPDGKIIIGGAIGALTPNGGALVIRNRIARLNPDGTVDPIFNPNTNADVVSIAVQADGKVLLGGDFTLIGGAFGETRNHIGRVETDGKPDRTLDLGALGSNVRATAVQPDGKILIGGNFNNVLGVARSNIARLNTDGTLDTGFNPNANGFVLSIAVQADGKILAGGTFTTIGGQARNHIARLEATGLNTGLADSLDPNANSTVSAIALQADGKILAGGIFTNIGGQSRNQIARLDATTGGADSFDPNPTGEVRSIAVQADGKILAGGNFTSIGGQARNLIARLDATTGLADSFNPNANDQVLSIAVQSDGKILAGGFFTSIGGQTRNRIARLDATTGLPDSFNPNADNFVLSIVAQADGKVIAGGGFTSIAGQPRNYIARLDAATGLADSFNPSANSTVDSIAVQADGKVLAGGDFSNIGGQTRNLFARLSNDTAAPQDLAITQTTITWTRGGSSPQFTRVTFEYSNDNVNYTPLGTGTSSGDTWTRTGLSLSTGVNFYIRARGYYRSGEQNGSESITESVRNAFVAGPTAADATISGQVLANDGAPIPGAIVNLTGTQTRKAITDASGNYRFDNVETSGFYTVTPLRLNYSFSPASRSFSQLGNTTQAVFTATPNALAGGNAIDSPEYFVRQHYVDFLNREPDESGFNFWSDQLLVCGADAGCLEQRRINVSAAYFLSIEFQQTGGLVDGLYRATYGRRPNYVEFVPDRSAIANGVVVARDGWESQLEMNKQAFIDAWVQRAAFIGAYGNLSNDGYVNQLIAHTGVNYRASERDALVSGLTTGTLTRATALRQIVENQSFVRAKFNQTFVMMQYFGYLRRDPDDSGYQFWLAKLNQFNGNFQQAEMVKAFISSVEYRQRFGSP